MTTSEPATLPGALDLLERAIGFTRGALAGVRPELMARRTPCERWDLRELLEHMDDSLQALLEATELGYVVLSPQEGPAPIEPLVERIRSRACAVLGGWARQDGAALVSVSGSPVSARLTATAGALAIAVHGWDVAQATGARTRLPASLATDLLREVPLLVTEADRPERFAPPVPVVAGATPSDRLVAALGRRP